MPLIDRKEAQQALSLPKTYRGHQVTPGGYLVIYDDIVKANQLAKELQTEASHAELSHPHLKTISVIKAKLT
jgi:hypothetical protein